MAVYGCSDVTEFYFDIEEEVNTLLMFDVIDMDRKNISKDLLQEIERTGLLFMKKFETIERTVLWGKNYK